jgi:hypothetical protein
MSNAFLGFLSIDVIQPPEGTIWGVFNNRPLDVRWVNTMSQAFAGNLDNCTNKDSMDAALNPTWLKNRRPYLQKVDGLGAEDVPLLEPTAEGELAFKKNNLWMLGGNHRRMALIKYLKVLQKELERRTQDIAQAKEGKTADQIAQLYMADESTLKASEARAKALEARISTSRLWTVKVYNKGTRSDRTYVDDVANPTSVQPASIAITATTLK